MPLPVLGRRVALLAATMAGLGATARAQPVSGNLVLYTSQPEPDAQATVAAFRQAHPAVTVEWVRGGTNQIIPRLRAEFAAGSPRPDVLLIADALTMESLKAENRLQAWAEAPLGGTLPDYHDPEKFYFGTKLITTGIARNNRAPAITAWRDLLAPAARNLAVMPSPAVSGAAALHVLALAQNPALGWPYWEALARQQNMQARGGNGQVLQAIAGGEKAYGMIVDFLPIREAAKGAPVSFIFPEEGVTAITEPAAILASARNVPAARAFIAFLLSREGQETATRMGYLPADPNVAPPAGFPAPSGIKVMPFDARRALAESDAGLKRFADLFGG
jgi:iron(III) transport system substrate-binding protein